jgi:hypothetical protein
MYLQIFIFLPYTVYKLIQAPTQHAWAGRRGYSCHLFLRVDLMDFYP